MAGSVNKVILIGNLGNDPETRRLENGTVLSRISIATSEVYTDKNTGEKKEITEWHNVVLWRRLGEIAEKYLRKGAKVYIEGKLKTRSWEDEQKNMRYTTEIVADNMTMLSRADQVQSASSQQDGGYGKPIQQTEQNTPVSALEGGFLDEGDDQLPF